MEFKVIDMDNWSRKETFEHFSTVAKSTYSLTVKVDVTNLVEKIKKENIAAVVTQTGCMGYCYAEPTVEVKKPGQDPVVFSYVDVKKAEEIVDKYIRNNELLDGILPANYQTI